MAIEDPQQADFAELLFEHQGRLFGMIYSHTLNLADTEDLYQQVALVLWQKFDQFEPGTSFKNWSLRVAELTIKNYLRTKRRNRLRFSDDLMDLIFERQASTPDRTDEDRRDALRSCVKKLTLPEQQLIDVVYGHAKRVTQIAEETGVSAGSLYTALTRIRQALLACIERQLSAEGHR